MEDILHNYLRDRKQQPVGVLVAQKVGEHFLFGWSKVNVKCGDKFDKNIGISLALGKALRGKNKLNNPSLFKPALKFINRCRHYFKTDLNDCPWYKDINFEKAV